MSAWWRALLRLQEAIGRSDLRRERIRLMKPNPAAALEALAVYDERRYKLMSLLTLLRPPPALSRKDVKTASQLKRVRELDDEAMRKFQREVRTNAIDAKILVARKLMDEAWAAYLSARDG